MCYNLNAVTEQLCVPILLNNHTIIARNIYDGPGM